MVNQEKYNLEERTFLFAQRVRKFIKQLTMNLQNQEDCRMHLRISRKEAKESRYWLRLVDTGADLEIDTERNSLIQEATELMRIFSSIINNSAPSSI